MLVVTITVSTIVDWVVVVTVSVVVSVVGVVVVTCVAGYKRSHYKRYSEYCQDKS